jgi:CRISPR-associated protein Cas2
MSRSLAVLATSSVPVGVRGALTQWYLEVLPGIFVGTPTARVRDLLWKSLCDGLALDENAYAALIQESNTEQRFTIRTTGAPTASKTSGACCWWPGSTVTRQQAHWSDYPTQPGDAPHNVAGQEGCSPRKRG